MIRYKVLTKDLCSPYQGFRYELGRWYDAPDCGQDGESVCVRGLYAVPIEGLLYRGVWRQNEAVYRCEVSGESAGDPPFKTAWPRLRVVSRLDESQVRRLARRQHKRLGWNLEEALYPVNPLRIDRGDVTGAEAVLLDRWASVRDSVEASVGDSVRAYIGSLFPCIEGWKYIDHAPGEYPYQPAADLWRAGLVPSYDGKAWRLHAGEKAEIVYERRGVER